MKIYNVIITEVEITINNKVATFSTSEKGTAFLKEEYNKYKEKYPIKFDIDNLGESTFHLWTDTGLEIMGIIAEYPIL